MSSPLKALSSLFVQFILVALLLGVKPAHAEEVRVKDSIDRIDIANQQINLLKSRFGQAENELAAMQRNDVLPPLNLLEQAGKNLLDKAMLDIAVSKSNLDSISIELTDARQTTSWLAKIFVKQTIS